MNFQRTLAFRYIKHIAMFSCVPTLTSLPPNSYQSFHPRPLFKIDNLTPKTIFPWPAKIILILKLILKLTLKTPQILTQKEEKKWTTKWPTSYPGSSLPRWGVAGEKSLGTRLRNDVCQFDRWKQVLKLWLNF